MKIPAKCKPELCVSKDDARFILKNLHLKGKNLFATDGRHIVRIPVELEPGDTDGLIPATVLCEARASTKTNLRGKRGAFAGRGPTLVGALEKEIQFGSRFGLIKIGRDTQNRYPNTDQVMPEVLSKKKHSVAFQPRLLLNIAQAMGCDIVTISFDDEATPIFVFPSKTAPAPDARGILMPCLMP